jgi:putative tricarboxylic transport membrane protein
MTERPLALAVVAASGVYLLNALPLPLGTAARPGAGFFPLGIGLFGIAFALAWTASAFRRAPAAAAAAAAPVPAEARGRVVATTAALVGFCLLLPWVGYPAAALVFAAGSLRWLGASWRAALVIGLAGAAVSYYFFGVLLSVPLPRGALFD